MVVSGREFAILSRLVAQLPLVTLSLSKGGVLYSSRAILMVLGGDSVWPYVTLSLSKGVPADSLPAIRRRMGEKGGEQPGNGV